MKVGIEQKDDVIRYFSTPLSTGYAARQLCGYADEVDGGDHFPRTWPVIGQGFESEHR